MPTKLATLCFLIAFGASSQAFAENLVDHSGEQSQSNGSVLDFFGWLKRPTSGGSEASDDHGCGPVINAAGDAVYVNRPGCPRS